MKTLVFDLDGTLIDSAGDLRSAANRMLADLSLPALDRETVITFIGRGVEVLVRRALDHSGAPPDPAARDAALAAFRRYYAEDLTGQTRPYPGVMRALDLFREAGFRMAVCTNKPEAPARDLCDHLGLSPYFDAVVGGDTLAVKKPDPAPLHRAFELLGSDGSGGDFYIGDSETDWLTAKAANVAFAYFEGGYQRTAIEDFRPALRFGEFDVLPGLLGED